MYHPERDSLALPHILYALGDPVRLSIVQQLASDGELTCTIAYPHPIPKSTLSYHLRILREAGIIHVRQQGRESYNSLRQADLEIRFPGVLNAIIHAAAAPTSPDE